MGKTWKEIPRDCKTKDLRTLDPGKRAVDIAKGTVADEHDGFYTDNLARCSGEVLCELSAREQLIKRVVCPAPVSETGLNIKRRPHNAKSSFFVFNFNVLYINFYFF